LAMSRAAAKQQAKLREELEATVARMAGGLPLSHGDDLEEFVAYPKLLQNDTLRSTLHQLSFEHPSNCELGSLPGTVHVFGTCEDQSRCNKSDNPREALLTEELLRGEYNGQYQWACRLIYLHKVFHRFVSFKGKNVHGRCDSYKLKHRAENLSDLMSGFRREAHQYVSNGVMIAALIAGQRHGFSYLQIDRGGGLDTKVDMKKCNAGLFQLIRELWYHHTNNKCSELENFIRRPEAERAAFTMQVNSQELMRSMARLVGFTCQYSGKAEVTDGDSDETEVEKESE